MFARKNSVDTRTYFFQMGNLNLGSISRPDLSEAISQSLTTEAKTRSIKAIIGF